MAALLLSELVTNSVLHGGGTSTIATRFELAGDVLRVEVSDDADGLPLVKSPSENDTCGRGLQLVDALASEWGVTVYGRCAGKTVFFVLRTGET